MQLLSIIEKHTKKFPHDWGQMDGKEFFSISFLQVVLAGKSNFQLKLAQKYLKENLQVKRDLIYRKGYWCIIENVSEQTHPLQIKKCAPILLAKQ